jgi:hypothetical protein
VPENLPFFLAQILMAMPANATAKSDIVSKANFIEINLCKYTTSQRNYPSSSLLFSFLYYFFMKQYIALINI